jgi:hypothetical protein
VLKGSIDGASQPALMGLVAGVDASCADKK